MKKRNQEKSQSKERDNEKGTCKKRHESNAHEKPACGQKRKLMQQTMCLKTKLLKTNLK